MRMPICIFVVSLLSSCAESARNPSIELGTAVTLLPEQTYSVRDRVSEKFSLPRAVHMHPMSASRNAEGVVTVCGLADAFGQEGPTDAMIGYRAYTGVLIPDTQSFGITGFARTETEQKAIFRLCREIGAPIVVSPEVEAFARRVSGGGW